MKISNGSPFCSKSEEFPKFRLAGYCCGQLYHMHMFICQGMQEGHIHIFGTLAVLAYAYCCQWECPSPSGTLTHPLFLLVRCFQQSDLRIKRSHVSRDVTLGLARVAQNQEAHCPPLHVCTPPPSSEVISSGTPKPLVVRQYDEMVGCSAQWDRGGYRVMFHLALYWYVCA